MSNRSELKSQPRLVLHIDQLDNNCKIIAAKANSKTIRIATKSIRSIPVLKRILASNSVFQGLMCYNAQEALFLHEKGFDDIVIAYPSIDKEALKQIALANKNGAHIVCMVDNVQQVDLTQQIAKEDNGLVYICLDIDMSTRFGQFHFGVRRSPLRKICDVLSIAAYIKKQSQLRLIGMMGYEAQIAGVQDELPNRIAVNKLVQALKKQSISAVSKRRHAFVRALMVHGFPLQLINGGGTGSVSTTVKEEVISEVTVGSGFYSPKLFDYYKHSIGTKPALFFTLPIVRKAAKNVYTCSGGGYIASGSSGEDKLPVPVYPAGSKLISVEGAGEVQTPVFIPRGSMDIGDVVVFRAAKAGEICERFNEIICVSQGKVVDCFPTYRGEGVCFF
ncbi:MULTISPECIES: alanine racemase [Clostridia]|uniref:alanine racemase n=1 Tax=Clostridia TaxID=186801 RepID=UPI000EA3DF59|nr:MULTISPECIES: alanine racemase [Clostridia]NBJ70247.1 amino acid deaminase/aldolase [Roseburia sp. 1XD42-34]RKI76696.1 amino acid deaminase/aldolase [Clostridium sp. 1xD42-85]